MNNVMPYVLSYYNGEVSQMICQKYGMEQMSALRKFLSSQTYEMLSDESLEMWDFSPSGIFDMYERYHVKAIENAFSDIDSLISERSIS